MGRFVKNRELDSQSYAYRMSYGASAIRPQSPVDGQFRFNTDTNVVEVYYNSTWNSLAKVGNATIIKDSQGNYTGSNLESADGSRTTFTMSQSYNSGQEAQVLIYVGNIFQNPGVAYTFDGSTTVTFTDRKSTRLNSSH